MSQILQTLRQIPSTRTYLYICGTLQLDISLDGLFITDISMNLDDVENIDPMPIRDRWHYNRDDHPHHHHKMDQKTMDLLSKEYKCEAIFFDYKTIELVNKNHFPRVGESYLLQSKMTKRPTCLVKLKTKSDKNKRSIIIEAINCCLPQNKVAFETLRNINDRKNERLIHKVYKKKPGDEKCNIRHKTPVEEGRYQVDRLESRDGRLMLL